MSGGRRGGGGGGGGCVDGFPGIVACSLSLLLLLFISSLFVLHLLPAIHLASQDPSKWSVEVGDYTILSTKRRKDLNRNSTEKNRRDDLFISLILSVFLL